MDIQSNRENKPPFIVNNGIIYNKRDILMLLRDLGNVTYFEVVKGKVVSKGKGYIMRVCSNSEEPTLFLGGRIYINVGAFDYLRLTKIKGRENTLFELYNEDRVIRIMPDEGNRDFPSTSRETLAERMLEWGRMEEIPPEGLGGLDNPLSDEWFEN